MLVAFLAAYCIPALGQSSTEGKEFWVALNMTTGTGGTDHEPFICITTQHPGGSYTITNPADASFTPITGLIPPTGYIKIKASTNPSAGEIDLNKWYPVGQTAQAASNTIKNVGLKVTTTVVSSVYAGNRLPQSFDAANILPVTALQMEYITQDYPGYDHENKGGGYPVTTILATENNTQVTFTPSSAVLNGNGTTPITKTLNAGQVLYFTGDNRASLSGSVVRSDKKIAVFTGVNNTDVPGPVSARDHLYEQNMPTDYWGTHFVVTRSMKKDANRIRVTAKENGTSIYLDGSSAPVATINTGETYEFELCSAVMRTEEGYTKAAAEGRGTEYYLEGDAHYLETSCPCAVYSYDVSENYYIKKNGTSERDPDAAGDPAMVWISPLEQQLRKVTFGVMNTDQTPTHYVNIITPTSGAASLEVKEVAMNAGQVVYGKNLVQPSDVIPVPGNTAYSYARIKLNENAESVYTITSGVGFIAHVYGSGNKESYAYSAGSAAVEQGVKVNGYIFTNGYISDDKFCMGTSNSIVMQFDAKVGTDEITRVDWDFGDGISENHGAPQTAHTYYTPGWYDVTANLYGHQVCTNESEMPLGTIRFTFRVIRPYIKYVPNKVCQEPGSPAKPNDTADVDLNQCQDTIEVPFNYYPNKSTYSFSGTYADSVFFAGKWITTDGPVTDTLHGANSVGCDSIVTCNIHIITSLDFRLDATEATICSGEDAIISYNYKKGTIDQAWFEDLSDNKKTYTVPRTNLPEKAPESGAFLLPTSTLEPGRHQLVFHITDSCVTSGQITGVPAEYTYPIDLTVYYPADIFTYEFNNVLAVWQKGYGGNVNPGWDFTAYQWYRNGTPIDGATSSVYHTAEPFTKNDEYYVELTRRDGLTLRSCSQTIIFVDDFTKPEQEEVEPSSDTQQAPSAMPAKLIRNQQMLILHDGEEYNMFGQRVR